MVADATHPLTSLNLLKGPDCCELESSAIIAIAMSVRVTEHPSDHCDINATGAGCIGSSKIW